MCHWFLHYVSNKFVTEHHKIADLSILAQIFLEKFENLFKEFWKHRKISIQIIKNWPKIVIFIDFLINIFEIFSGVPRNHHASIPPTSLWPCPKNPPPPDPRSVKVWQRSGGPPSPTTGGTAGEGGYFLKSGPDGRVFINEWGRG